MKCLVALTCYLRGWKKEKQSDTIFAFSMPVIERSFFLIVRKPMLSNKAENDVKLCLVVVEFVILQLPITSASPFLRRLLLTRMWYVMTRYVCRYLSIVVRVACRRRRHRCSDGRRRCGRTRCRRRPPAGCSSAAGSPRSPSRARAPMMPSRSASSRR